MGLGTLTAFALWPIHASATYITGSYAGTVRTALSIQQEDGPPLESIEYGPISGTFGFETDIRTLQEPPDRDPDFGDVYAIYYRLPMRMEFNSSRFNDVFDNDTDAFGGPRLEARQENGQQHLVLDISGPYWYADISFAGLLFDSLNPLTFDPRFIDVAGSTARFSGDIRYVANSIADVINMHGFRDLMARNYVRAPGMPKLCARRIGEWDDLRTLSFALRNLIGANIIRPDDPLEAAMRKEFDLPLADESTVRLPPAPQSPFGGDGGAPTPPDVPAVGPPRQSQASNQKIGPPSTAGGRDTSGGN